MNEFDRSEKVKNEIGLYKRIVQGLEQKPAYLLIFSISALFVLSGLASSASAIVKGNLYFGILAVVSFAIALLSAIWVVILIEPKEIIHKNHETTSILKIAALLKNYIDEYSHWHTPDSIIENAPKLTKYNALENYSADEIQLILDALYAQKKILKEDGDDGKPRYLFFD